MMTAPAVKLVDQFRRIEGDLLDVGDEQTPLSTKSIGKCAQYSATEYGSDSSCSCDDLLFRIT